MWLEWGYFSDKFFNTMKLVMNRIGGWAFGLLLFGMIAGQAEEARILEIREMYQTIENSKDLKKEVISLNEKEAGGMTITRFMGKDGVLRKMTVKTMGDHGVGMERYYFADGKLFFVFAESEYWKFTGKAGADGEGETMDVASERRLYFSGEKCVLQLLKEVAVREENAAKGLLAKEKNKAVKDAETATFHLKRSNEFSKLKSKKALEAYLEK